MAKFTKKAIMDCFLNMLKRKNIDRVTVTDICEECGINRNTFYYYFSDIYDVLDSVLIEETEKNIDITEDATFYETYSKAASVIIEYRAAVIHVYNSRNRDIIEKNICIIQQNILLDFLLRNILKTISLQKMTESI